MVQIARIAAFWIFIAFLTGIAHADQGGFTNAGGTASASTAVTISSSVSTPPGTLNISCPSAAANGCVGGSFNFASSDGTQTISASFTSGSAIESCYGGGRGGHTTCYYTVNGNFSGTETTSGAPLAIVGVTAQSFESSPIAGSATGTTGYNPAYTPFYYSDSEQILRADDLQGDNQITYGSQGGGVGNFYGAYGLALDSQGRIYVADTYNCRVVRIDDMTGANWTSYGACGAGQGQFYDPDGIAVDSNGKIYVMDTGNSRFVRIDDMTGTNWTTFGSVGSGVNQFLTFNSVTIDSSNHIYVADTDNLRVVRMDDFTGTNWTVLSQSPPINGFNYRFTSPVGVAFDATGRIYVADAVDNAPAVIRVDDMTGTNWTSIAVGAVATTGLTSIAVTPSGTVLTGGGGVHAVDDMLAVLTSSGAIAPFGTYYVFGVTAAPVASPLPSAISIAPGSLSFTQNIGTPSVPGTVTLSNFGGSPLNLSGVSAGGPFSATDNCPSQLSAGSSCTASVTFTPTVAGPANDLLTISDDSGNAGISQTVKLNGTGTTPGASVSPTSINFPGQLLGTTSGFGYITLKSNGTGPLQVTSVIANAPFSAVNGCTGAIAPGSSCTISVSFTPTTAGPASGAVTITDNAGTQTVKLSGTGVAPVSLSSTSLNFGRVKVGTTSPAHSVYVMNNQSVAVSFTNVAASSGFAVASNTCSGSLAAKSRCTVGVTFSPSATGSATGTLTITDNASNSPQTMTLKGTGD